MGFDLYGADALNETGKYFRNNIWWWRPLWDFICTQCNDILTEKQQKGGSFNSGTGIGPKMSIKIADKLQKAIDTGLALKEEKENKKGIKEATKHNKKLKHGDPKYDWREAYPFSVGNLKEFIEFAKNSGGFNIY